MGNRLCQAVRTRELLGCCVLLPGSLVCVLEKACSGAADQVSLREHGSGRYLRHRNGVFVAEEWQPGNLDDPLFPADASFHPMAEDGQLFFGCTNDGFAFRGLVLRDGTAQVGSLSCRALFPLYTDPSMEVRAYPEARLPRRLLPADAVRRLTGTRIEAAGIELVLEEALSGNFSQVSLRDADTGRWLRHAGGVFSLCSREDSAQFREDGSFCPLQSEGALVFGCSNRGFASLGLVIKGTRMMVGTLSRASEFILHRMPVIGEEAELAGEVCHLMPPLNGKAGHFSLQSMDGGYLYIGVPGNCATTAAASTVATTATTAAGNVDGSGNGSADRSRSGSGNEEDAAHLSGEPLTRENFPGEPGWPFLRKSGKLRSWLQSLLNCSFRDSASFQVRLRDGLFYLLPGNTGREEYAPATDAEVPETADNRGKPGLLPESGQRHGLTDNHNGSAPADEKTASAVCHHGLRLRLQLRLRRQTECVPGDGILPVFRDSGAGETRPQAQTQTLAQAQSYHHSLGSRSWRVAPPFQEGAEGVAEQKGFADRDSSVYAAMLQSMCLPQWVRKAVEGECPLVSVVLPVYNTGDYLEECLDSLLTQSLTAMEIICIDDGSDDRSPALLRKYAAMDPRIRLFSQEHRGAAAARNLGLREARGVYLSFLDSDDVFASSLLLRMVSCCLGGSLDIAVCRSRGLRDGKTEELPWTVSARLLPGREIFSNRDCRGRLFQIFNGWAWDKLFRREFVLHQGLTFQDVRFSNDARFTFGALCLAERMSVVDNRLVLHRYRSGSIEALRRNEPLGFLEALKGIRHFLEERNLWELHGGSFLAWEVSFCRWQLTTAMAGEEQQVAWDRWLASQRDSLRELEQELESVPGRDLKKDLKSEPEPVSSRDGRDSLQNCAPVHEQKTEATETEVGTGVGVETKPLLEDAHPPHESSPALQYTETSVLKTAPATGQEEMLAGIREYLRTEKLDDAVGALPDPGDGLWLYGTVRQDIPAVSIIIPVHNSGKYLRETLDSVRRQTFVNFEVLCVDDGSTDSSPAILGEYAASDPRFRVLRQENSGAGEARNHGLEEARGDFVSFLDSDDMYEPPFLERMLSRMTVTGADVVTCRYVRFYDGTDREELPGNDIDMMSLPDREVFSVRDISGKFFQLFIPVAWNRMYRRKLLTDRKIRFQSLQNSNDTFFVYSALLQAEGLGVLDEILLRYRIREGSLVRSRDRAPFCFLEAQEAVAEKITELGLDTDHELMRSFRERLRRNTGWNLGMLSPGNQKLILKRIREGIPDPEQTGHDRK